MDQSSRHVINATENYVKRDLASDTSGHDWWHVERVRTMALRIASDESGANSFVIELASLLHHMNGANVSGEESGPAPAAKAWLNGLEVDHTVVDAVSAVLLGMSFTGSGVPDPELSTEARCVRDADRLDALGAIGVARAFTYGGHVGRPFHVPGATTDEETTSGRVHTGSTIDHFSAKLLLLRDTMTTELGRSLADHREQWMIDFLMEFSKEWDGTF